MEFDLNDQILAKQLLGEDVSFAVKGDPNGKEAGSPKKRKRKEDENPENPENGRETDEEDEEIVSGEQRMSDTPLDDKSAASRRLASHWIQTNFSHNTTPNYTGLSKDFVYQLYRHVFSPDLPFLSVGQFTRLFNEIMYKEIEYNPRARKTPTNQVIQELYPLTNIGVEMIGKQSGNKERRISYFPKVCLNPTIKELKDCVVNNENFSLQTFVESLRTYKKRNSEAKMKSLKPEDLIDNPPPIAYRIYNHEKYLVVAVDLPGIDPNDIDISFPTEASLRLATKEGLKTYEEKMLQDNMQFSLVGGRRKGNLLANALEVQLPTAVDIPYPSNTTTPFIHDHYGTVVFKFGKRVQEGPTTQAFWSKEELKFD